LLQRMVEGLQEFDPIDGIMLAGHGAAVGETIDDLDGHWFKQIRNLVGRGIPLVATLDPHGNLSVEMVEATDAIFAYKTNPHIDQRETGRRAAHAMLDIIRKKIRPVQQLKQLPLAISIEQQCSFLEPCLSLYKLAGEMEKQPGVIQINIMLGFPYADVEKMGSSLLVVTDNDPELATNLISQLAEKIKSELKSYSGSKISPEQAIKMVSNSAKPVLFLDMGDNIGGGSPGNSTMLLKLLNNSGNYRFYICLYEPDAVKQTELAKPGERFDLQLKDDFFPMGFSETVQCLYTGPGRFKEDKPVHGGKTEFDMGRIAIVETDNGGVIMLTSIRMPPFSLKQLTSFGIDPKGFDIVVAKGVNAPLAAYKDVCPTVIQVDTPGITQADITRFSYLKRRKPMFPFETIDECNVD
jgi:microcystin degradation protein MlrC